MLPELTEPRVLGVVLRSQREIVRIEIVDVRGLRLDCDAAYGLVLNLAYDLIAVSPPITASKGNKVVLMLNRCSDVTLKIAGEEEGPDVLLFGSGL